MDNAAFIIGSERSGTNLLRILLDNHKELCAPVSPHFLDAFKTIIPYYGNLNGSSDQLISDMLSLANHPFNEWNLKIENKSHIRELNTFMKVYDFIYENKAKSEGKNKYISKDIHLYQHMSFITKYYKDPRFIYLTRDVRDHVASWLKSPIYLNSPQKIARKWKHEQKEIIKLENENPQQFIRIRYEDLIGDTEANMTRILNFLELEIDVNCFSTEKKKRPEANRNQFWKNLSKPVNSGNLNKYKKALKKSDIKLVESITGDEMKLLGYNLDFKGHYKRHPKIEAIEEFIWTRKARRMQNEKMKKELDLLKDKQALIRNIKNRLINDYKYYY